MVSNTPRGWTRPVLKCVAAALGLCLAMPLAHAGEAARRAPRAQASPANQGVIVDEMRVSAKDLNLLAAQPAATEPGASPTDQTKISTPATPPATTPPGASPEPAGKDSAATQPATATETNAAENAAAEYRIGAGDALSFQSFDDPTLSREQVLVLYDGNVSLPMISDVNIMGMTRKEAEAALRTAYQSVFKNPQIALSVKTSGSKYFYILGQVARPAKYPYEHPLNILEAVNEAGGLRTTQQSGGLNTAAQGILQILFLQILEDVNYGNGIRIINPKRKVKSSGILKNRRKTIGA